MLCVYVCARACVRERGGEGEPPSHLTPNPMVAQQASALGYAWVIFGIAIHVELDKPN